MRSSRSIVLLSGVALAGCGAATVDATRRDGGPAADAAPDVGADAAADGAPLDREDSGAPYRDVPLVPDDALLRADGVHVVEVAGSEYDPCARMSDGTVRCRGRNWDGQLGIGSTSPVLDGDGGPVTVPGLRDVEQIVRAGFNAYCARLRDGTVWCWGSNTFDLLGVGHEGDERCGPGGTGTPCRSRPTQVSTLREVVQLAPDFLGLCAVTRTDGVWCWGTPAGVGVARTATPVRATVFPDLSALWLRGRGWIARRRDGSYQTSPGLPPIPREAVIAEGESTHLCYGLPDATVRCLGQNANGKVGNGRSSSPENVTEPFDPGLRGVRSIVTGAYHTCAATDDLRVHCWGDGTNGGLGFVATEDCVGVNQATRCATRPTVLPGLDGVVRVFPGTWAGCAQRTDASLWCWGIGRTREGDAPVRVAF